jgi:hypothetical protein
VIEVTPNRFDLKGCGLFEGCSIAAGRSIDTVGWVVSARVKAGSRKMATLIDPV